MGVDYYLSVQIYLLYFPVNYIWLLLLRLHCKGLTNFTFIAFTYLCIHKRKARECRKMCLNAENSFCEACEYVPPSELRLFVLDEVGQTTSSKFELSAIMHTTVSGISVTLKHGLGGDG